MESKDALRITVCSSSPMDATSYLVILQTKPANLFQTFLGQSSALMSLAASIKLKKNAFCDLEFPRG